MPEQALEIDEIWEEYFPRLVGLVRAKLTRTNHRARDEEDIALSALNSYFQRIEKTGESPGNSEDDLWRVLSRIATNKLYSHMREELAEKRGGGTVRGDSAITENALEVAAVRKYIANGSSEQIADSLCLACREMIDLLPREILRQVAVRRLEGYKATEIALELDVTERTVQNKLKLIRKIWTQAGLRPSS